MVRRIGGELEVGGNACWGGRIGSWGRGAWRFGVGFGGGEGGRDSQGIERGKVGINTLGYLT